MSNLVLKISDLYKSFGDKPVFNGLSLELFEGENLVVMGASGMGKSVLIKCIVGLLDYDKGKIEILGNDIESLSKKEFDKLKRKIGFLFQGGALYDSMNVNDNLLFPVRRNLDLFEGRDLDEMVESALEKVGLSETRFVMPSELSGGMRKRIGLARTIIMEPDIILYDEPTTGLDPITTEEISNLILKVQNDTGASSIIITHDLKCARITSSRILFLNEGEIRFNGKFEEIISSKDPWISKFVN